MLNLIERDTLTSAVVSGLSVGLLLKLYASLEGRARRELDLNFGQSRGLHALHDSITVVAAAVHRS